MRRLGIMLCAWGILVSGAVALAADEAALMRVTPAVDGEVVRTTLVTRGLPGEKQLRSMRSGLEAAVELDFAVLDDADRPLGGRTVVLRLAFDLWDEVFALRADGAEQRFASLDELRAHLAVLPDLAVAPSDLLAQGRRYRVHVAMAVHAVAPDERDRVGDVIAGEDRRREGANEQEASVSLGRLIRFFYRGGDRDAGDHEIRSDWFAAPGGGR